MEKPAPSATARPAPPGAATLLHRLSSVALAWMPLAAFAQVGDTENTVEGFFDNIQGLLNIASVAIVTIAIIFAGYQIAFAHKRIADVAPILVGGLLIGAAAQIARMLLPEDDVVASLVAMLPLYA